MADDAEPGSAATLLDVVDFDDQRFGIAVKAMQPR